MMKKQFRSKLLPVLLFASLSAFVYVNTSSKCISVCVPADKVLVEQGCVDGKKDKEAADAPSVASGIVVFVLSLAQRFLPVSNS